MKLLVTGGAGFIGVNFVRYWLEKHPASKVVVLDALTYAGNRESLADLEDDAQFEFVHGDIRIIHLSTDYVFPGTGNEPHKPNDPTQPVNQYGKSKREGEELLLASGAECLIIRTGWLYAPWGHNFLTSMRKLMVEKQILEIVSDQTGTPTSVLDLAPVIWQLTREKEPGKNTEQIMHWTNTGTATWFEFAYAIRKALMAKDLLEYPPALEKISSMDYAAQHGDIAHRPHYSVLDATKSYQRFGKTAADWHAALSRVVENIT